MRIRKRYHNYCLSGCVYQWREENVAKIKYHYDAETRTFYIVEEGSKHTFNLPLDEDMLLRVDLKKDRAVGLTITNFDLRFPKLEKLFGTSGEEFIESYFEMFLNGINELKELASEKGIFKKFIIGEKIDHKKLIPA